jgi:sugar-phosphatase
MQPLVCEAVIFDLDGVLIDSSAVIERCWRQWAVEHGLDGDRVVRAAQGQRMVEVIRSVAPHLDAEVEAQRQARREVAETEGLVRIEGAGRLTCSLPQGAWAVATSANRVTATARLRYAGLPIPSVLVTADDVSCGKPDPQVYLLAAGWLGVRPERCLVVEDAPVGVKGARAAGMQVVAVATTHPPEALAGADAVAARLADIHIVSDGHLGTKGVRFQVTVEQDFREEGSSS